MKNIMNNEQSNLIERIQAVSVKLASLVDQGEDVETDECCVCAKSDEWLDKDILLDEEIIVDYCDHINCGCQEEAETKNEITESPENLSKLAENPSFTELMKLSEILDERQAILDEVCEIYIGLKVELDNRREEIDGCLGELLSLAKEIESYTVSINKN